MYYVLYIIISIIKFLQNKKKTKKNNRKLLQRSQIVFDLCKMYIKMNVYVYVCVLRLMNEFSPMNALCMYMYNAYVYWHWNFMKFHANESMVLFVKKKKEIERSAHIF